MPTLLVLGDEDSFETAVKRVINEVKFDNDQAISVFETTIRFVSCSMTSTWEPIFSPLSRMLGGLLSTHLLIKERGLFPWYKDELLLKANDLGTRLLPAFNTPTVFSSLGIQ